MRRIDDRHHGFRHGNNIAHAAVGYIAENPLPDVFVQLCPGKLNVCALQRDRIKRFGKDDRPDMAASHVGLQLSNHLRRASGLVHKLDSVGPCAALRLDISLDSQGSKQDESCGKDQTWH
ncbi:hypothetical protein C1J05_10410 [Sulfitobacter sp. JL08]|uniref:hypothetical protein n=1 Tax=Sulfitobacter sp. JL08 TaxID=2070369 RepID=UPI000E0B58E2|nr:hypothetical protein [Sulfitobacter sp. JL08]AXI54852.1 hypothetical protein C1J05_10410 [Sulfitobacter sp. JL08]